MNNGQGLVGIRIYLRGGAVISAIHPRVEVQELFDSLEAVDRAPHFKGASSNYGVSAPAFNWIVNTEDIVGMNTFQLPPPDAQLGAQAPLPPGASGLGPFPPRLYN